MTRAALSGAASTVAMPACTVHGLFRAQGRAQPEMAAHPSAEELTGGFTAQVSGCISNLPALRGALLLAPDAEPGLVLQAGWRAWSAGLFARLDGVFSIAIHERDELHLYRHPSGLAGLFFRPTKAGGVEYATALEALCLAPGERAGVRRGGVQAYLRFLDLAAPLTIAAGVEAVEPGQYLHWQRGSVRPSESTCSAPALQLPADRAAATTQLDALLRHEVSGPLSDNSVQQPAAFLSGGIDSALLCALAACHRPDTVAVTVGFDGERFDEAAAAARIAAHLGLRHEVLRFSRHELLAAFHRMAQGMDQPMADPATMATVLAFDHCRQHFGVVLDGTGADEAVGAMPARHVRWAVGVGSRVPAGLRRWLVRGMQHVPALAGYTPVLDFEHPAETLMRWKGFTRAEIEELCGEPVSLEDTPFYRTFARYARSAHFERYSALLNAMPSDRLSQATKLTSATVRYPFCARDVDTFLRQLPTEWRYLPGQPKRILRELLARYVPRDIWDGPKHSFDFPLQNFLAGDGHALVHQHVLQGRWLERGLLRPQVVRRHARQYMAGDQRLMFRIWALVVLGAWLDAHEDLI